jgi:hypothetical protein
LSTRSHVAAGSGRGGRAFGVVPREVGVVAEFSGVVSKYAKGWKVETHLGLTRCAIVKRTPRTMQSPPMTTYAMPKKGFLPPTTDLVEMRMDFVPP